MLNTTSKDCKFKYYVHIVFSHSSHNGIRIRAY